MFCLISDVPILSEHFEERDEVMPLDETSCTREGSHECVRGGGVFYIAPKV